MEDRSFPFRFRLATIVAFATACSLAGSEDAETSADSVRAPCVTSETLEQRGLDGAVTAWLQSTATDLGDEPALLRRVLEIAGDAKIVGLGEPDHGFHDFAAIRNAVFKTLVQKKDFAAITFESGLMESRIVDQYVTDVAGVRGIALSQVLKEGFSHSMGEFAETAELVEWVHAENVKRSHANRPLLRWGGIDLSVLGDTLILPMNVVQTFYADIQSPAMAEALTDLAMRASEITLAIDEAMMRGYEVHIDPDHLDGVTSLAYDQLTDAEARTLKDGLAGLLTDLDTHRAAYVAAYAAAKGEGGEDAFEWARTMVLFAQQIQHDLDHRLELGIVYGPTNKTSDGTYEFLEKAFAALHRPFPTTSRVRFLRGESGQQPHYTPEQLATYQKGRWSREKHLAENVRVLSGRVGKTFAFEATGHLQKARGLEDSGFGYAQGEFLAEELGADYVVIAGTASEFEPEPLLAMPRTEKDFERNEDILAGNAARRAEALRPESFERRFDGFDGDGLIVDLRSDPGCSRPRWVDDWLATPQLTWTGAIKARAVPRSNYDAVLWVRRATQGQRLQSDEDGQ